MSASATISGGERPVYVPINPCRVMDTRSGSDNVGPRSGPLVGGTAYTFAVRGTNGNCTIPADAVGLGMNVTAINPTAGGYITVYPSGAPRPLASNLNVSNGQSPVPNSVTTNIGADGSVSVFANAGTVDLAADIVGYYVDHNHDDRYYTKAQVDAVAGPTIRSISFPAQSLNSFSPGVITQTREGLLWTNDYTGEAQVAITRPADFAGTGSVTLRVIYNREWGGSGTNVQFFGRPRSWAIGDTTSDASSVLGTLDGNTAVSSVRESVITFAASMLAGDVWDIVIQRNDSVAGAFTGKVTVRTVTISYNATR